jgi:membrane-bound lytic murein transglycosylase F
LILFIMTAREHEQTAPALLALVALVLVLAGCDMPASDPDAAAPPVDDDLTRILSRGTLRVLRPQAMRAAPLPRDGYAVDYEDELVEAYARSKGLRTEWIYVDSRAELIPSLLEQRGDFIPASLVTPEDKQQVRYTVPLAMTREQVVSRADERPLRSRRDLVGRTIVVRRDTRSWDTARELARDVPGVRIELAPPRVDPEEILRGVACGRYDLTIAESVLVQSVSRYESDLRPVLDVTRERPVAWAVNPGSKALLQSLNLFLSGAQLTHRGDAVDRGDLPRIQKRGVLRVLTRNNPTSYYIYRGEQVGFDYELLHAFAERSGLELEIIVPPRGEDMLAWLVEGRGDIAAASLTPTAERRAMGVSFSEPYNFTSQFLVARSSDSTLNGPQDLVGRRVAVRRSSAYWTTLEQLLSGGVDFELVAAPEEMETAEIIGRVATGEYDLTVADDNVLAIELERRDDVRGAFALTGEKPVGWAVRSDNPGLLTAVNRFVRAEYRGTLYNILYARYFRSAGKRLAAVDAQGPEGHALTPYDDIVRRYAEMYGFDWRLIAAVMYEESRFDPKATSSAGARGLMQVMPETVHDLGFDPAQIEDPEVAIHAGVRYLAWVRERFDEELPVRDRMWFTLAGYNAGYGHVEDARRLAASKRLNPNRWFDNVERAMALLERPEVARETRYGYCRCSEPIDYVRSVRARYNAYLEAESRRDDLRASL